MSQSIGVNRLGCWAETGGSGEQPPKQLNTRWMAAWLAARVTADTSSAE